MKTIEIEIIKKNRVWFDCLQNNYKCKLKVDDKSQHLDVGIHTLLLNDVSIRSKYGTDIRYEVLAEAKEEEVIFLKADRYNEKLVSKCRYYGGKWDSEEKVWCFCKALQEKIDELENIFNSTYVDIEITALECIIEYRGCVSFCGYPVAEATSKNSGALLSMNVHRLTGQIDSGGSVANWFTCISEGSKFVLKVSKNVLEKYKEEKWSYKII